MKATQKERCEVMERLSRLGIAFEDAHKLRRISLTLRRWFERECGDDHGCIERDEQTHKPYWLSSRTMRRSPIADREAGARKRLAVILAKYPTLQAYIQTDPRGAALHLLTAEQVAWNGGTVEQLDSIYSRGTSVY